MLPGTTPLHPEAKQLPFEVTSAFNVGLKAVPSPKVGDG